MDRHVDGHTFGGFSYHPVSGIDVRYITPTAEDSLHITLAAGFFARFFKVLRDPGILIEIGLDEHGGFLTGKLGGLLEAVFAHAVDDAEVHRLGKPALVLRDLAARQVEQE